MPTDEFDTLRASITAHSVTISGRDGHDYLVRPISPADAPSLIRGYDAMTEQGKWFRMLHTVPHLSPQMAERFCNPDPEHEFCIVIEGRGELEGEIIGGARIAGLSQGGSAEFSVSLRPEARGLSLARQALELVIEVAREEGCREVYGLIARRNLPMRMLAERIGFQITTDPDDRTLFLARLPLTSGQPA